MLKGKYVLLSLAAALVCWQAVGVGNVNSGIIDPCKSTATAAAGIVLVCPFGDGDQLSSVGSTITLTVNDGAGVGIPGIPATDMWLVGCTDGLLLCGGSQGSNPALATDLNGVTTFVQEPAAGGCDTGLYVVVQGSVIQTGTFPNCTALCLPIQTRSPDYKSSGAPGPAPCAGDLKCPDSKVSSADFSWFTTHYTYSGHPGSYIACADYAAPFESGGAGSILRSGDFAKFVVHFAGAGHKCPI